VKKVIRLFILKEMRLALIIGAQINALLKILVENNSLAECKNIKNVLIVVFLMKINNH